MKRLADQVALALRRSGGDEAADGSVGAGRYRRTPDRTGFALGWILANAIVGVHYGAAGVDALPSYDVDTGWDRFLITRRAACWHCADDLTERLGTIVLDSPEAPVLVCADGGRVALRDALRRDPDRAVGTVLERLRPPPLPAGDHSACWHEVAGCYPVLYAAVTDAVLEHPDVVAAREVFVDDREVDGSYHPLYLHGVVTEPRLVYDWFAVEAGEEVAYVRITGRSALYRTASGTWSTVGAPLAGDDPDRIKRRLLAWLRIGANPDPQD